MAKVRIVKTSFVTGELSQQVFGRVDKDFYGQGADKLRNVYVNPLGGIMKREGLKIIDTTPNNTPGRLIDFIFNNEQKYLFVFSEKLIRIYRVESGNIVKEIDLTGDIPDLITEFVIPKIKFVQSADTLILTEENLEPLKITRKGIGDWSLEKIKFDFIPYWDFNGTTVTSPDTQIRLSSESGRDVVVDANADIFNNESVGQQIVGKRGGILLIRSFRNSKQVVGNVAVNFPGSGVITLEPNTWEYETGYEPSWSPSRGYPKTCTFFQTRLWFGGSKSRPATIWASQTGKFFNFDEGSGLADEAIERIIDDDKINAILNIYPGRSLQVFTTGGEFFIPQGTLEPITPTNTVLQKSTMHGSSDVRPVSVDGSTIFIERTGRVVREYIYNEQERSYSAKSISLLSSQLIREPIDMNVCQSRKDNPADYAFIVNSDGTIAVLNILRSESLVAWSLFETEGKFESITVVDKDIFVITNRNINGQTKRFIELFDRDSYFDASLKKYSKTPTTEFSGLDLLAGQEVGVKSETFILPNNKIDKNGNIKISLEYDRIEVGINFKVLVKFLPIDSDLGKRTITGNWRNVKYIMIRSYNTKEYNIICGKNIFTPSFRRIGSNLLDKPISTVSDWKKIYVSGGISRDATVEIVQESPEEFQIIFVVIAISI